MDTLTPTGQKRQRIALAFLFFFVMAASSRQSRAEPQPSPATPQATTPPGDKKVDGRRCRSEALLRYKKGELTAQQTRQVLGGCEPAASPELLKCQKLAFEESFNVTSLRRSLLLCHRQAQAGQAPPSADMPRFPFHVDGDGQIQLASLTLGPVRSPSERSNCAHLDAAIEQPQKNAVAFGFGNNPLVWKRLAKMSIKALEAELFPVRKDAQDDYRRTGFRWTPKLGQVQGLLSSDLTSRQQGLGYLPMGRCQDLSARHPIVRDAHLYSVVDPQGPRYFSPKHPEAVFLIAFFDPYDEQALKMSEAEEALAGLLTTAKRRLARPLAGYRRQQVYAQKTYIAEEKIVTWDQNADPANLCQSPRRHDYLGILRAAPTDAHLVESIIVADIYQLCRFGDVLAARMAP